MVLEVGNTYLLFIYLFGIVHYLSLEIANIELTEFTEPSLGFFSIDLLVREPSLSGLSFEFARLKQLLWLAAHPAQI